MFFVVYDVIISQIIQSEIVEESRGLSWECNVMDMKNSTFDQIIYTSQNCVFWKDKERRGLGANKVFLDFLADME